MSYISKGSRVKAEWFKAEPFGTVSLSGTALKTTGSFVQVTGTCRHFRSDGTEQSIRVYIDSDQETGLIRTRPDGCECAEPHIEIQPGWIVEVL